MKKTLAIVAENGGIKMLSEYSRGLLKQFLRLKQGKKLWLTIEDRIPKRSERQNSYYWAYLSIIENETGNDRYLLHEFFKQEFLEKTEGEVFGKKISKTKSTTDLNKNDFAEYILEIENMTKVLAPNPEDYLLDFRPPEE